MVAWARKAPLVEIATVRTRRTRRNLLAADGTVLAEFADDEVTGTPAGSAGPVVWREWELELVEAEPDLLEAADELMADAGARAERGAAQDPARPRGSGVRPGAAARGRP